MSDADDSRWALAVKAAQVAALDPETIGGIVVRARAGPVRDAWLQMLRRLVGTRPLLKMPASIDESRLLGGLDLAATLATGRPVAARGLLAQADGGLVVVATAERLTATTEAQLTGALDRGGILAERDGLTVASASRFGIIALDEGEDDERVPAALADRLAILLDLDGMSARAAVCPDLEDCDARVASARTRHEVSLDDDHIASICRGALALGIESLRAPMQTLAVARALARLAGHDGVADDDLHDAVALVLAPRAIRLPPQQEEREDDEPRDDTAGDPPPSPDEVRPLDDIVLEAAQAALPPNILAQLAAGGVAPRARSRGKAGERTVDARRGRRVGTRAGHPKDGTRLDLVATLRAAAPWQRLRDRREGRIAIRSDDLRIARFESRARTTTIFLVDASGSAARERLAEAKGAVRLMLADCYIRRDEVALMAFRSTGVELLLPPTRSLVRAERMLAALPGGGGTPLAAALDAVAMLARAESVRGRTPTLIVMSDGRANVARDGSGGRPRAHAEALEAAGGWRTTRFSSAFIDTSAAPGPLAAAIADAMGGRYVPLPFADARGVEAAVRSLGARR